MNCYDVEKQMEAYVGGRLPWNQQYRIKLHLKKCPACSDWHETVCAMQATWRQPTHILPSASFAQRVMAGLDRTQAESKPKLRSLNGSVPAVISWQRKTLLNFGLSAAVTVLLLYSGSFEKIVAEMMQWDAILSSYTVGALEFIKQAPLYWRI